MSAFQVFAIGGDPGGASALAPVIAALRARGCTVEARAYRHAGQVWARLGLDFAAWPEDAPAILPEETQLLLTSTSLNGVDLEKHFLVAAARASIPSLAVLDYWSNYRQRFSIEGDTLDALPDAVAVMDETARTEMIEAGIAPERLVVTGQPAFDDLGRWRNDFTDDRRRAVRTAFGIHGEEAMVVFVSQPFARFYGSDDSDAGFVGYDERSVVTSLIAALEGTSAERKRPISLLIRPHPRENPENFASLKSDSIRIQVSSAGDPREVVCAADLVVGMSSILLVEACYLGCLVMSLQPNLRGLDPLPTNRLGISRAIYHEAGIFPAVRDYLFDPATRAQAGERLARLAPAGQAAGAVADLAEALVQRSSQLSHS